LVDPDPGVITNLLNNSRVTEQHVLAICSRRPTVTAPLTAVIKASSWFQRYRIKLALVKNPHLALKFGLNILAFLNRQDLQSICEDMTLSTPLRGAAERLNELAQDSLIVMH